MPQVEIDFMGLAKSQQSAIVASPKRASFRDIQKAVSRINPEILRSVIASGGPIRPNETPASKRPAEQLRQAVVPVPIIPASRCLHPAASNKAPMTIFYGGKVLVLDDVPPSAAEAIMVRAASARSAEVQLPATTNVLAGSTTHAIGLVPDESCADLPLSRRKSLQKFLEKRQNRLTAVAPYPSSRSPSYVDVEGSEGPLIDGVCEEQRRRRQQQQQQKLRR